MNLFDPANYPTREPTRLVVGDRWVWKRPDLAADYPVADYALKYSLRLNGTTATEIEIAAAETGGEYVVEVASATTAGYSAGRYTWQLYVTRTSDSQRLLLARGTVDVLSNQDVATTDPRSHARKVLEAIEAVLERRASVDQEEYSIAGRSLKRTPIEELLVLRDRYREEVRHELAAERVAKGLPDPNRIGVRLQRV